MKIKGLLSFILIITLLASPVLSLSSCMQVLELYVEESQNSSGGGSDVDNTGSGSGNQTNQDNSGSGSPTNPDNNGGTDENNGGTADVTTPDNSPSFYPDLGDAAEGLVGPVKALLSAVSVYSAFEVDYGYGYQTETTFSRGSGVIYKIDKTAGDAYIITNFHVVYNANGVGNGISKDISIYLYGQENKAYAIPATYVGGSFNNDIAVLKVTDNEIIRNSQALAATVADSDDIAVLDNVIAVGNPEGYGLSATNGIVSVESESLAMTGADGKTQINPRVIRISAAINDGNSGGGLFNEDGNLIGVVNAKRNGTTIDNIAYAIPSNVATRLAESIIYFCDGQKNLTPMKAMLQVVLVAKVYGVSVDTEAGTVTRVEIVEVDQIADNSAVKGMLEVGDRVNYIMIDGVRKDVTRVHHVIDMMLLARVGSVVKVGITRGDTTFDFEIIITESNLTSV